MSRKRRYVKRTLRWCGACSGIALLALAALGVYLNQVGLPVLMKRALLAQLQERGFALEFVRMRIRLGRGVVADQVQLRPVGQSPSPTIRAEQLQLKLDWKTFLTFNPKISALQLRGGGVDLPLTSNSSPAVVAHVEGLGARLVFVRGDLWILEDFNAMVEGLHLTASGNLTNAQAWLRRPRTSGPSVPGLDSELSRWLLEWRRMKFDQPPTVSLRFEMDPAHLESASAMLELGIPEARQRTRELQGAQLTLALRPQSSGSPIDHRISVDARAVVEFMKGRNFSLRDGDVVARIELPLTNSAPVHAVWSSRLGGLTLHEWQLNRVTARGVSQSTQPAESEGRVAFATELGVAASRVRKGRFEARTNTFEGNVLHSLTALLLADGLLKSVSVEHSRGHARQIQVSGKVRPIAGTQALPPDTGPWQKLGPYAAEFRAEARDVVGSEMSLAGIQVEGGWQPPRLKLEELTLRSEQGVVESSADVDVVSRVARLQLKSRCDMEFIGTLLATRGIRLMDLCHWSTNSPPEVRAEISATLPGWTNRPVDWSTELWPSVKLSGSVEGNDVALFGLEGQRAAGAFAYTNRVWHVPTMRVEGPQGELEFSYTTSDDTRDFHFHVRSSMNPSLLKPLVDREQIRRRLLDFQFAEAPIMEGDIWGRWKAPELLGFSGNLSVSNLAFRGESADELRGNLSFTNGVLDLSDVFIRHQSELIVAPGARFDSRAHRLSLTNVLSTMSVSRVTKVIGPKISALLAPYKFDPPPRVVVNGWLPTRSSTEVDARFDMECERFNWWRIRTESSRATILALTNRIVITNVASGFYGGNVHGDLRFDTVPRTGARMRFELDVTNAQLHLILDDLWGHTNRLEGRISGRMNLDSAETWNMNSWTGHGFLTLSDGYLWDIPLFGVFSPVLDGINPGLGQSRFTSGQAHFRMTNSVLRTDDLEVRSPAMRLYYRGTVDNAARLDATMQASLLRDAPVVGPVLNLVLNPFTKLFEYKVGGTLAKPVTEPLYLPKFLLAPLHPIRTIKGLFSSPDEKNGPGP